MNIPEFPVGIPIDLPARGSWPDSRHVFDERSVWAVKSALAAQRPLLVRGEPGTGKSQLARAAAECVGRLFVSEVVHARSESQDLLWRFDAVGRLGEAQALGTGRASPREVARRLNQRNYLSPGPLWWVFDWETAMQQHERSHHAYGRPEAPAGWTPANGSVLLIDEIDKADAELPNGLLETLGNGAFSVPWRDDAVRKQPDAPMPLIVITTNEERELPAAFTRRCLVLNLALPKAPGPFQQYLIARGRVHFGDRCSEDTYREAAEQLWKDREDAREQGLPKPGQTEYIDLLRVVVELSPDHAGQMALLAKVKDFALRKHPEPES